MAYDRRDPAAEGRFIVAQLGGRWTAGGGLCRCPAHDDRHPSLSVRPGRTRLLFHCFAGCTAQQILQALERLRLISTGRARPDVPQIEKSAPDFSNYARRIWSDARLIAGTPAARYLRSRGLRAASSELRYHPRTPHGAAPLTCYRPAVIAAVRDDTGIVGIHRTFLDPATGAPASLARPKLALGSLGNGAVRLGGVAACLGLAEGIETALSVMQLFGLPCWATLGAERFAQVSLPGEVRCLFLFLDNDQGGRRAEALARRHYSSLQQIEIRRPQDVGFDWNDVLVRHVHQMSG